MTAVNKMFFTSLPVSLVISGDVISGDVISAQPRFHADRARLGPKLGPRPPKYPNGQACHVTQIRLSDWSKLPILRSDWLVRILSHSSSLLELMKKVGVHQHTSIMLFTLCKQEQS